MAVNMEHLKQERKDARAIVDELYGRGSGVNPLILGKPGKEILAAYASIDGTLALEAVRAK